MDSSSCVIEDNRTFVSSAFSRRTRTVSVMPSISSRWSASAFRLVAACSSILPVTALSESASAADHLLQLLLVLLQHPQLRHQLLLLLVFGRQGSRRAQQQRRGDGHRHAHPFHSTIS